MLTLSRRLYRKGSRPSFRKSQRRRPRVEQLEVRNLLSTYPITPSEMRHAYGFDQVSGTGAGQTIAIVDAFDDPNISSDLHTFDQRYGLADPVFTKATPQGQPAPDIGWAQEISLDVEWAHAIAQGANILLVESVDNSLTNLLGAVDYAASQAGTVVVSMSWGSNEFSGETGYDSHFAHSGVTFVASAGDTGSVTEWPAVSPNVVGVGGTSLHITSSGGYRGEAGWSGSGGGISSQESKPSYQTYVTQSNTKRTSPDVAYEADPNTGVAVYDSYVGGFGWGQYGGTSVGAPQWSALVAIADQGRSTPLSSSGTLNGLYGLLNSSHQIDTTKLNDITRGSSGHYSAAPGYDLVTGLGTPKANTLIPYLQTVSASVEAAHSSTPSGGSTTKTPVSTSRAHGNVVTTSGSTDQQASQQNVTALLTAGLSPVGTTLTVQPSVQPSTPVPAVVAPTAAVAAPVRLDSSSQQSGGGDNAMLPGDDSTDAQDISLASAPVGSLAPPAVLASGTEQTPAASSWQQATTAWFQQEQPVLISVPERTESGPEQTEEPSFAADPIAAALGLAVLLGAYGAVREEESSPDQRKSFTK